MLLESKVKIPIAPQNLTVRLNPDWNKILELSAKYNISSNLFILIDVTLTHHKVSSLGSVLKAISTSNANHYLGEWSKVNPSALFLYQLSSVVLQNSAILNVYLPLPEESAALQLHGQLDTHFLLAMLLERIPPGTSLEREWFEILRIWLLVQAIQRGQDGNVQDQLIKKVAEQIRLGGDKNDGRFSLMFKLKSYADDFSALNSQLIQKSERLVKSKELKHSYVGFLKSLSRVARGERSQKQVAGLPDALYQKSDSHPSRINDNLAEIMVAPWELIEDPGDDFIITHGNDDDVNFFSHTNDNSESLSLQSLRTGSVILYSVEDSQHLPWSWDRPNPEEIVLLESEVSRLLLSANAHDRLLGAFVWLAMNTGRSLRRAMEIKISSEISEEWSLDPNLKELRRLPPIRKSSWIPKNDVERNWVRPVVAQNRMLLPERVTDVLRTQYLALPNATLLWQLWDASWPNNPESHFKFVLEKTLPRVLPGMLRGVLPLQLYLKTQDETFSKISASHPSTGLPAACAYANWTTIDYIPTDIPGLDIDENSKDLIEPIIFGSRLDIIEERLVAAIKEATQIYHEKSMRASLVEKHNYTTAYNIMMLFAATGARAINDPFESVLHFDFERHFVYIDDKSNDSERNARLVPLPLSLSRHLQKNYIGHLKLLARVLSESNPTLSCEIDAMANGQSTGRMPFFFMLQDDEGINWQSVTSSSIQSLELLDCPLPANLFRQRLAKQLRRRGLEDEIIEGVFGHGDAGSESYSDYSTRIWADDADIARRALTASFEALPFVMSSVDLMGVNLPSSSSKNDMRSPVHFGQGAREQARRQRLINTIKLAKAEIDLFLNTRELAQLEINEIDHLTELMLFHDNKLPRRNGYLRYEYLIRRIEKVWQQKGKQILIKKRYVAPRPSSPFNQYAPQADSIYSRAQQVLKNITATNPVSRLTSFECAMLASILLMIEGHLADFKILKKVSDGKNFRLVTLAGKFYVEFCREELINVGNTPVRRMQVSIYCAYLLAKVRASKKSINAEKKIFPIFLKPLAELLAGLQENEIVNNEQLLTILVKVVDQHNVMHFSGVLAGYLSGRLESTSLGWRDWIRIANGRSVQIPDQFIIGYEGDESSGLLQKIDFQGVDYEEGKGVALDVLQNTRDFFKKLRDCFVDYGVPGSNGPVSRQSLVGLINHELDQMRCKIASGPLLLGYWIKHLVISGRKNEHYYAISSIERYLSALSPRFTDLAYQSELMAMDGDEITDLYENIILSTKLLSRTYVGDRLRQFHAFARRHGVEDPDWDEISFEKLSGLVSPGVITNDEYHSALQVLLKTNLMVEFSGISLAMLLFMTYRFGLRGKEALGMLRSEWNQYGEMIVLQVSSNRIRKLKTRSSRRQVPLLFSLLNIEHELMQRYFAHLDSIFGSDINKPMFERDRRPLTNADMKAIRSCVIAMLKTVTGNPEITLHHARHTAANRVALGVFGLKLDLWKGRAFSQLKDAEVLLLGTEGNTRRAAWATARYLGHAGRDTQFRSYLHFMSNWADSLYIPIENTSTNINPNPELIIRLDDFAEITNPSTGLLRQISPPNLKTTPLNIIKLLHLMAIGKSSSDAALLLQLDQEVAKTLQRILDSVALNLKLKQDSRGAGMAFLKMIKKPGWDRLIEHFSEIDNTTKPKNLKRKKSCNLSIKEIAAMVGASRQILLCNKDHFRLVKGLIIDYHIHSDLLKMVASNLAKPIIYKLAKVVEFKLLSQSEAGKSNYYQIDALRDGKGMHMESRCGISLIKNSDHFIRTSYELILIFVVYLTCNR